MKEEGVCWWGDWGEVKGEGVKNILQKNIDKLKRIIINFNKNIFCIKKYFCLNIKN